MRVSWRAIFPDKISGTTQCCNAQVAPQGVVRAWQASSSGPNFRFFSDSWTPSFPTWCPAHGSAPIAMSDIHKPKLIQSLMELVQSRLRSGSSELDTFELQHEIAQAIDDAMFTPQEAETRQVTVLLSDLRGFTSVSEKYSAMQMVEALNRYLARMSEIILSHGGVIDKFMGDAIMVLFGAPHARNDDVQAALACAIDMQSAMQEINATNQVLGMAPFYMGIGINTGEMVAGRLGSALHSEYTVIGDQVNLVSRIEAHSLRGQILLSENTHRLARSYIETGDVNEVRVKGKKGMVRMFELLGMLHPEVKKAPLREIRNSPRVEVDLPVRVLRISDKTIDSVGMPARVVDISYGGMSVMTPEELEPFDNIQLALSLSLLEPSLTEIYAKTLSAKPTPHGFECRIEFTSIDADALHAVKELVNTIVEMKRH